MSQDVSLRAEASRSRETSIVRTLVLLADTLAENHEVADVLDRLVTGATDLLQVVAAGLMLADNRGQLSIVAASSEESRVLELYQVQTKDGPCLDCVMSGHPVISEDLANDLDRWPLFVPAARSLGFEAVHAVPMRLRENALGALNLFLDRPGALSSADAQIAQGLADVATISILHQRFADVSSTLTQQLERALGTRVVIEQAKGMLAVRAGTDVDAAFGVLRRYARNNNLKLGDVAREVVRGGLLDELS